MQIGKRVRRLEMAQQAQHRRRLREKQHAIPSSKVPLAPHSMAEFNPADDSDLRYFISPSLNEKKDIYGLLKSHSDDPAYKV
jgi:hypothetical protein